LLVALSLEAHRVDEYLQASLIHVLPDRVEVEVQLTPGLAVVNAVLTLIDRNADGRVSSDEERDYANWVANEVDLRVDGKSVPLQFTESRYPTLAEMRQGLGTIHVKLSARAAGHTLAYRNRHLPNISAYLVNCLSVQADGLSVGPQQRDPAQKSIAFDYSFAGQHTLSTNWLFRSSVWLAALAAALVGRLGYLLYRRKTQ
jgi:hypothetical protein